MCPPRPPTLPAHINLSLLLLAPRGYVLLLVPFAATTGAPFASPLTLFARVLTSHHEVSEFESQRISIRLRSDWATGW